MAGRRYNVCQAWAVEKRWTWTAYGGWEAVPLTTGGPPSRPMTADPDARKPGTEAAANAAARSRPVLTTGDAGRVALPELV